MNYALMRGTCKQAVEALIQQRPELRAVRGHYFCPIWNSNEAHWWAETKAGDIVDPTKDQFASGGLGSYTEFDGVCHCEQCGKDVAEEDAFPCGNFAVCSTECAMHLVGVY